mmetsp:Transcript_17403/g.50173  ORF Transcript_17403/g.50173 Transcript_17403/m.50173 type:complete len:230 (-) Transcript_17403:289-978(-)
MGTGPMCTRMALPTTGSGSEIASAAPAQRVGRTEQSTRANSATAASRASVCTRAMAWSTRVSSRKTRCTALAATRSRPGAAMSAGGSAGTCRGVAGWSGPMARCTTEASSTTRNMVRAPSPTPAAFLSPAVGSKGSSTGRASAAMGMACSSPRSGSMVSWFPSSHCRRASTLPAATRIPKTAHEAVARNTRAICLAHRFRGPSRLPLSGHLPWLSCGLGALVAPILRQH